MDIFPAATPHYLEGEGGREEEIALAGMSEGVDEGQRRSVRGGVGTGQRDRESWSRGRGW